MLVKQISTELNAINKELLGETAVVQEDLSDIVTLGELVFDSGKVDNYVNALVDRIGRSIIVDRLYEVGTPSVIVDNWEFGSVCQKISYNPNDASDNTSWQLVDGVSYNQDVFVQPKVRVKYFNSKTTFEIKISLTDEQIKEAFTSAVEMARFVAGIEVQIKNDLTAELDALIMRTINTAIAETLYSDYANTGYNAASHLKSVNLLYLYNQTHTPITSAECLENKEFLRFATQVIKSYPKKMERRSTLFNVNATPKFTPKSMLHFILLDDFKTACEVNLYTDLFNKEDATLPASESVAFWQGSGTDFAFNSISKVHVTTESGTTELSGILGVMFDRQALGVMQKNRRVKSHRTELSEFVTYAYKEDAEYFVDTDENIVVFFIA